MPARRLMIWLVLAAALLMGCSGYAALDYYDDDYYRGYDRHSDCPRYWILAPLDCDACHWYY